MRIRTRRTKTTLTYAAVLLSSVGLSLATAGPAAAADGNWSDYGNTNPITSSPSEWKCDSTVTVFPQVGAQACAVRTASGTDVQGAVIVRNNSSNVARASVTMTLRNPNGTEAGTWRCSETDVKANSWFVCFGETIRKLGDVKTSAAGTFNGETKGIGVSPYV
ncbi:hypothetical protein OG864_03145 [Streptomyces sp. NBC_00124]|uniref:hypothetical protein n=1 Tax=Streptomyces sp. NBC_00124 TaxID=2975662 RepID=UPI002253883A|nr:hypothetical protein [Streptomyces sp. NBC_00124]MCX5357723.1 hypothetical protein [Streptomyces sp. NBC_00124]